VPAALDLGLAIDGLTITYTTAAAGTCQLQSSEDLKSWQPSGDPVISAGTPSEITAIAIAGQRRYYRVAFHP